MYDLMVIVEVAIKTSAEKNHGSLYGEWAKKEECWIDLKKQNLDIDFNCIKADLEDPKNMSQRKRISDEETEQIQIKQELDVIKSISSKIWNIIQDWGRKTEFLSEQQKTVAYTLSGRIRTNTTISDYERHAGIRILDLVIEKLLNFYKNLMKLIMRRIKLWVKTEITIEVVNKILNGIGNTKRLKDFEYIYGRTFLREKPWTEENKKNCFMEFS